jgi:hypothetical protein
MERSCNEDDYEAVKLMVPKWIGKQKVIFSQLYSPDLEEQLFVLVMQIDEMLRASSLLLEILLG